MPGIWTPCPFVDLLHVSKGFRAIERPWVSGCTKCKSTIWKWSEAGCNQNIIKDKNLFPDPLLLGILGHQWASSSGLGDAKKTNCFGNHFEANQIYINRHQTNLSKRHSLSLSTNFATIDLIVFSRGTFWSSLATQADLTHAFRVARRSPPGSNSLFFCTVDTGTFFSNVLYKGLKMSARRCTMTFQGNGNPWLIDQPMVF